MRTMIVNTTFDFSGQGYAQVEIEVDDDFDENDSSAVEDAVNEQTDLLDYDLEFFEVSITKTDVHTIRED